MNPVPHQAGRRDGGSFVLESGEFLAGECGDYLTGDDTRRPAAPLVVSSRRNAEKLARPAYAVLRSLLLDEGVFDRDSSQGTRPLF